MHPLTRDNLNAGETLPSFYGRDSMVLMARDPYWLFAYWELTWETINGHKAAGVHLDQGKKALRVIKYDHQGSFMSSFDIFLEPESSSWYIYAGEPDRTYQAQLGFQFPDGNFKALLISNRIHTPRDGVSSVIDPLWGYLNFWQRRLFYRTLKFNMNSAELLRREKAVAGRRGGEGRE